MISLENSPEDDKITEKTCDFGYNFSQEEIKLLALFLRKNQNQIPGGLEGFARQVELYIYSNMSIDEVEKFYS